MGLKYICSGSTYDISGPEHEPVSNKKHRLNYVVSGSTKQIGLATNSSCTQYSPLRIKTQTTIDGNNVTAFYIGRSESSSASEKLTYTSATLGYHWIETWTQSSYTYTNGNKSTTGTTYQTRSSTSRYDYWISVTINSNMINISCTSSTSSVYKWFSTTTITARYTTSQRAGGAIETKSGTVDTGRYTKYIKNGALTATSSLVLDFTCTTEDITFSSGSITTFTKTTKLSFNEASSVSRSYTNRSLYYYTYSFRNVTKNTTMFLDSYLTLSDIRNSTKSGTFDTTAQVITTNSSSFSTNFYGRSETQKHIYCNWNFKTGSSYLTEDVIVLAHYSTGGNVASANASQTTSSNTRSAYTCASTSGTVYGTQYITYTQNSYTYTQDIAYWEASATFTNTSQARTTSFTNGIHGSATASYVDTTSYTVSSSSSQSTHNFV